jgi:uncharacterized protein
MPPSPLRRALLLALASACAAPLRAQQAVPYYTSAHAVQGLYRFWYVPASEEFARRAAALQDASVRACERPGADAGAWRERWTAAVLAWDRLSAVTLGPLVSRRSQRRIDFAPVRPDSIRRAVQAAPAGLEALERIGATAKGLGALESMLWGAPDVATPQACRYAALLAQDIDAEARALATEFAALARRDWNADPAAAAAAMDEWINQWVGGLERLRWQQLDRPLRSAGTRPPAFPRGMAGASAPSWRARMQALAEHTQAGGPAAAPGAGLVPIENYLRGRGLNPLADQLAAHLQQAQSAVEAAQPGQHGTVRKAAEALGRLRQFGQSQVAPALEIQLGFSDSDGD